MSVSNIDTRIESRRKIPVNRRFAGHVCGEPFVRAAQDNRPLRFLTRSERPHGEIVWGCWRMWSRPTGRWRRLIGWPVGCPQAQAWSPSAWARSWRAPRPSAAEHWSIPMRPCVPRPHRSAVRAASRDLREPARRPLLTCSPVGVKGGAHKDTPPLSRWRRSVRFPATDTRALECERRDPTWVREREIERRLTAL